MESQLCTRIKDAESESVIHIPQEITENILTRLPIKSLVRFESVCKSWRSWLTNPDFRKRDPHSVLIISPSSKDGYFLTMSEQETQTEKFPLPWGDSISKVSVSNSCNGMVLICVGNCFYLFNPSTHYFRKVLTLDYMYKNDHDERHYNMLIGLYCDEASSDYKAVVLIQYNLYISRPTASLLVEASLKGKQWNHIGYNNTMLYRKMTGGPLVNGRLHWLNYKGEIIRFNPVLKVFENLPDFQPPIKENLEIVGLGFLDGCLCVSSCTIKCGLELLAMKEYGVSESWTRIFSLPDIKFAYDCNPLLLTKAGEILVSVKYFVSSLSDIWVYNLQEKSFKYLILDKEMISCAAPFVQNMDTSSKFFWNLAAEHVDSENMENFERIQEFW